MNDKKGKMCKDLKEENESQSAPVDKGPKAKTSLAHWKGKMNTSIKKKRMVHGKVAETGKTRSSSLQLW